MELVAACEPSLRFLASRKQLRGLRTPRECVRHNLRRGRATLGEIVLRLLPQCARAEVGELRTRHPHRLYLRPDLTSVRMSHPIWRARWVVRSLVLLVTASRNLVRQHPRQRCRHGSSQSAMSRAAPAALTDHVTKDIALPMSHRRLSRPRKVKAQRLESTVTCTESCRNGGRLVESASHSTARDLLHRLCIQRI